MSEKENWKKEVKEIVTTAVSEEMAKHQNRLSSETAKSTEHKHEEAKHEHFAVNLDYMEKGDSCPDCVKGLDKFGKEYLKKTLEERSKEPFICKDCGLGVKSEEAECPNCGGKDAEER